MSPRRPPQYPRFRGMIWQEARAARMRADDPIAEWNYVAPEHPDGIERSRLGIISHSKQREVVTAWFLSNFSPMEDGGSWVGYGTGGGPARYAPEVRTPDHLLNEEFGDVLTTAAIAAFSDEFKLRSAFWYLTPAVESASLPADDALVRALNRLAEAIERLTPQQPGIGHNSGLSASIDDISGDAAAALEAVGDGPAGREKGEQVRSKLQLALDKMVEGAATEAGKWGFRAVANALLPHLWDVVAALSRWLSSLG